jgi:Tfp pilus assembly protein PilF
MKKRFNLGNAWLKSNAENSHVAATSSFERALQLAPNDKEINLNMGILTRDKKFLKKAGNKKAAKFLLAQVSEGEGDLRAALRYFAEAADLDARDGDILLQGLLLR